MKINKLFKAGLFFVILLVVAWAVLTVIPEEKRPSFINISADADKKVRVRNGIDMLTYAYNQAKKNTGKDFKECSYYPGRPKVSTADCQEMWTEMKKYLPVKEVCDESTEYNPKNVTFSRCTPPEGFDASNVLGMMCNNLNASLYNRAAVRLKNGNYIVNNEGFGNKKDPVFAYDINGFEKPNKLGKDVFTFAIINNRVMPLDCYKGDKTINYLVE